MNNAKRCCATKSGKHQWDKEVPNWCRMCGFTTEVTMNNDKQNEIKKIENEMRKLYPQKELAYQDYRDNSGDGETGPRLWEEFVVLRDKWNNLVEKRKAKIQEIDKNE